MSENIKEFAKGSVIFEQGALELYMYDLLEGVVGIYSGYGTPEQKLLTELKSSMGVTFGEMGLIDSLPRSATAVAHEDVKACMITAETFGSYFGKKPQLLLKMMKNMSKRIRTLTDDYLGACRAVNEALESEKTGEEKSNWYKESSAKYIKEYNEAARMAVYFSNNCDYHYSNMFWR